VIPYIAHIVERSVTDIRIVRALTCLHKSLTSGYQPITHAKIQLNFLPLILDIYLLRLGVKRRVIESLSGLGICHSYKDINRQIKAIAESVKVCPL